MMPIVFNPALAAMLIAGIVEPQPRLPGDKMRWIIFIPTWLLADLCHLPRHPACLHEYHAPFWRSS